MLSLVDRIQAQIHSLRKAFSQLDWEMVTLLDKQSRILVKEVQATGKWDNSELHRGIVELSQLYSELQLAGRAERERLMSELTRMNQSKQVSQAYTLLGWGCYQGAIQTLILRCVSGGNPSLFPVNGTVTHATRSLRITRMTLTLRFVAMGIVVYLYSHK